MALFKRDSVSYAAPTDYESPYARAAGEWDNRIGTARVAAKNWRVVAMAAMATAVVLSGALTAVALQSSVKTYVVDLNEIGAPGRVTLLEETYSPTGAQVAYFLRRVVSLVRTIPTDQVVMRQNWEEAYGFLTGNAVTHMTDYGRSVEELLATNEDIARSVEVTNVIQSSESTFQIRWTEVLYRNGAKEEIAEYTGLFTYQLTPPQDEEGLFRNPLGIYVSDAVWSKSHHD